MIVIDCNSLNKIGNLNNILILVHTSISKWMYWKFDGEPNIKSQSSSSQNTN